MSQQDILDYLKQHPGTWFTARQIADGLGIRVDNVFVGLRKLRSARFVKSEYKEGLELKCRVYCHREDCD